MAKNLNSWDLECDKLFASEASGPQKSLKMGLGGNFKFCGYGQVADHIPKNVVHEYRFSFRHLRVAMIDHAHT